MIFIISASSVRQRTKVDDGSLTSTETTSTPTPTTIDGKQKSWNPIHFDSLPHWLRFVLNEHLLQKSSRLRYNTLIELLYFFLSSKNYKVLFIPPFQNKSELHITIIIILSHECVCNLNELISKILNISPLTKDVSFDYIF